MQPALGVSPFGSSQQSVLRIARAALDAGIERLWLGDGLLENPDFPLWSGGLECFTELAWLAGSFPEASLGCSAAVLGLRDPLWLAKQVATVDQLTAGRFVLAVAPGFWAREFAFLGRDFAARGHLFAAGIDALRAALQGDPVAADAASGPEPGRVSPPPVYLEGPPLWLAGAHSTLQRALRMGLPFQASRMSPDALEPWAREWRDRGGGLLAVRIRMEVGRGVAQGEAVEWNALVGPASFLADQLAAYTELGVGDVSIIPGQDEPTALATIEALASLDL